jgi:uncharacterized membrane-anchored protein
MVARHFSKDVDVSFAKSFVQELTRRCLSTTLGTTLADLLDRSLGVGYFGGTLILIGLLGATLFAWRRNQGPASLSAIRSRTAEIFY